LSLLEAGNASSSVNFEKTKTDGTRMHLFSEFITNEVIKYENKNKRKMEMKRGKKEKKQPLG